MSLRSPLTRSNMVLGSLAEAANIPVAEIPITEFSYISVDLPQSQNEIKARFGLTIDPLQAIPGSSDPAVVSSLVRSQTVEEFLYATHVGVIVVPDPKLFALQGADIAAPANPAPTPQFDGFVPPAGIGGDATARPAHLVWGHDTWQACWALLQAYDLRMTIGSRFQVFRELAANVGACASGGFRGLSHAQMSAVPYIRSVNDLADSRTQVPADRRYFIPQTVTAAVGQGSPTPAQPPIVDVAYGGIQLKGAFGGWYPLNGLLLAPGMPLNIVMERTPFDNLYYDRFANSLLNKQAQMQTYARDLQEAVTGVGFAGAKVWKGGLFRVGILIRGFSLAPLACYQGYQDMGRHFDAIQRANMYRESSNVMLEMLSKLAKEQPEITSRIKNGKGQSLHDEIGNIKDLGGLGSFDFNSVLALPHLPALPSLRDDLTT